MNDENIHMIPDPQKGIPEPEIPADEAWNNMASLLDAEMPTSPSGPASPQKPPSSGGGGLIGGISHNLWIILGVVGVVTVGIWGTIRFTGRTGGPSVTVHDSVAARTSLPASGPSPANAPVHPLPGPGMKNPVSSVNAVVTKTGQEQHSAPAGTTQTTSAPSPASTANDRGGNKATAMTLLSQKRSVDNKPEAGSGNINPAPSKEPQPEGIRIIQKVPADTGYSPGTIPSAGSGQQEQPSGNEVKTTPEKQAQSPADASPPVNNPAPENKKSKRRSYRSQQSPGMMENLSWQVGLSVNSGAVLQKGRSPNLFYGGQATVGLWHKKLKAGLETGIRWTLYNDRGSVNQYVRTTDSIPGDSMHPVTYTYNNINCGSTTRYRNQFIEIPLFITKQVVSKRKFSLDVKTGPVVGFMLSEKETTDSVAVPANGQILSETNSDYKRLTTTWQWHVMLQFRWNLSERVALILDPSGIFYLNNLYEKSNRPSQLPCGIGLNGGIIYRFK